MAESLLQGLGGLITPSVLETASRNLDAPKDAIAGGLGAAFPSILGGILGGAQKPGFLDGVTDLIGSNDIDTDMLNNVGGMFGGGSGGGSLDIGGRLLEGLFAGNLGKIAETIGSLVGLSPQTARTLLNIAAPIVLGMLKKRLLGAGALNPAGLLGLLDGERDAISSNIPSGLSGLIGGFSSEGSAPAATTTTPSPAPASGAGVKPAPASSSPGPTVSSSSSGPGDGSGTVTTIIWIVVGLAIAGALYALFV